ncbi:M15 family metallopeptidase [Hymenobacter koreensis]|uniref:D-alanyl-D-alanine dipeptidase n=1 Tax=Hymenobacter koreensis TaxID=1084523 RepID=A0ABP8IUW8_9BACT
MNSHGEIAPNAHGLPVLTDAAQYRQQVAHDPAQELVNLADFIPGLVVDVRYATPENFFGQQLYTEATAYLRRPVAEALQDAQAELNGLGFGLKVLDAYRPYSVTVRMFEAVPNETYAAPPWRGSRHNRGCSVDATLVDLHTGQELPMPTVFDDLSPQAHSDYTNLPADVLRNRAALHRALSRHGFVNYPAEWWHFDHASWANYPLLDLPFAALKG